MSHKETVLHALEQMKGDNLERAQWAFKNKTPEQMQEQYGLSGRTCSEIMAEYEAHRATVNAAIEWVNGLPSNASGKPTQPEDTTKTTDGVLRSA